MTEQDYVKCGACGNAVQEPFAVVTTDGKRYCVNCVTTAERIKNEPDPEHGRTFTDELKLLVKFHVEHNEIEHENFQMAAYLGELVAVIDSDKFKKLKREINAIVKKEMNKRITQGIEDKLYEYSHTRPPEDK